MELKFDAPLKSELLALRKYNVNGKDKAITVRNDYPKPPSLVLKSLRILIWKRLRRYDNYPSV